VWQYYLVAGEGIVSREPSQVTTVLGSCVSVTFFDPDSKTGGIFHALLPRKADYEKQAANHKDPAYRFVDTALMALHGEFLRIGARPDKLQIKVFGGAEVLIPEELCLEHKSVGAQNVRAAFEAVQKLGLRVTASDVGGNRGRKIIFLTHTGEVLLKRLRAKEEKSLKSDDRAGG
jgi:chemotaxis protein CheD